MDKEKKPSCLIDCLNYNKKICKEEGNISNGYEEYGSLCCPVFESKNNGIYKGLRY